MSLHFQDALARAEAAREGDSNDAELDAVWEALEVARPLIQAGQDVAGLFADGVGPAMTCAEADTIERWLRSATCGPVADTWVAGHALGDDDPDDAHRLDQFDDLPATQWPSWAHLVAEGTPPRGPAGYQRTATSPTADPAPTVAAVSEPTRGRAI